MFNKFIATRGSGKTGLQFYKLLEQLKQTAKTEEEKLYFDSIQKQWSEFCSGLTWRMLGQ